MEYDEYGYPLGGYEDENDYNDDYFSDRAREERRLQDLENKQQSGYFGSDDDN